MSIVSPNAKETLDWANICRVIAIFGVILIHACGGFFYQYGKISTISWLSANFLDSLVRCSVPVFVMLSGALLLKNDATVKFDLQSILKRALKVLLPLIVWSYIYLKYLVVHGGGVVHLQDILFAPAMYHLWFVYMILGLYLLLPFLQILYSGMRDMPNLQIYFFVLWLSLNVLPIYFNRAFFDLLHVTQFLDYGGYFIVGALLVHAKDIKKIATPFFVALYVIGVLITFFATWQYSFSANIPVEKAYLYFNINVFFASVGAFVLLSRLSFSVRCHRIFAWLSDKCFIIYFVHILVLERVRYNPYIIKIGAHLPTAVTILMIAVLVFLICAGIAGFLRLLVRNRYVFG